MRLPPIFAVLAPLSILALACSSGTMTTDPDASVVNFTDADQSADAPPTADADTTDADTTDADTTDADTTDGDTTDAAFACAPTGDFIEADDGNNDLFTGGAGTPAAEASGLTVDATGTITIGGCLDPIHANSDGGVSDADFYTITVGTASQLRIMVTSPAADAATSLHAGLWDPDLDVVAIEIYQTPGVLIVSANVAAGLYTLGVWDELPGATGIITYSAAVTQYDLTCDNVTAAADYTEAADGSGRDNDMIAVEWVADGIVLTAAADSPELTGLTLDAGSNYRISGVSADLVADADEYRDRDTFLITTGAATTELNIRLNWPDDDDDMDMILFPVDSVDIINSGTYIGVANDEQFGVRVNPSTSYWLWVATYDDGATSLPVNYDVSICATTFVWP